MMSRLNADTTAACHPASRTRTGAATDPMLAKEDRSRLGEAPQVERRGAQSTGTMSRRGFGIVFKTLGEAAVRSSCRAQGTASKSLVPACWGRGHGFFNAVSVPPTALGRIDRSRRCRFGIQSRRLDVPPRTPANFNLQVISLSASTPSHWHRRGGI